MAGPTWLVQRRLAVGEHDVTVLQVAVHDVRRLRRQGGRAGRAAAGAAQAGGQGPRSAQHRGGGQQLLGQRRALLWVSKQAAAGKG